MSAEPESYWYLLSVIFVVLLHLTLSYISFVTFNYQLTMHKNCSFTAVRCIMILMLKYAGQPICKIPIMYPIRHLNCCHLAEP